MKRQCRINFLSEPNLTKATATAKETYSAFVIAVTRATATRQRHAAGAKLTTGNFHRAELPARIALIGFDSGDFRFLIHALEKLSAIAMALRIAMDLLIVS
jgi:hypothetical protein